MFRLLGKGNPTPFAPEHERRRWLPSGPVRHFRRPSPNTHLTIISTVPPSVNLRADETNWPVPSYFERASRVALASVGGSAAVRCPLACYPQRAGDGPELSRARYRWAASDDSFERMDCERDRESKGRRYSDEPASVLECLGHHRIREHGEDRACREGKDEADHIR